MLKTWLRELKAFRDQGQLDLDDDTDTDPDINFPLEGSNPEAVLPLVLGYSIESIASLRHLQALFQSDPSIENLQALITSRYPLNLKQGLITKALFWCLLYPIRINSTRDQFLLYLGGIGGIRKTYLIKAFMFSLSII